MGGCANPTDKLKENVPKQLPIDPKPSIPPTNIAVLVGIGVGAAPGLATNANNGNSQQNQQNNQNNPRVGITQDIQNHQPKLGVKNSKTVSQIIKDINPPLKTILVPNKLEQQQIHKPDIKGSAVQTSSLKVEQQKISGIPISSNQNINPDSENIESKIKIQNNEKVEENGKVSDEQQITSQINQSKMNMNQQNIVSPAPRQSKMKQSEAVKNIEESKYKLISDIVPEEESMMEFGPTTFQSGLKFSVRVNM